MDYEILVNRNNKISDNEIDLVEVNTRELPSLSDDKFVYLEKTTYEMWLTLKSYAESLGHVFDIVSGYRTLEYQQRVLEYYIEELGFDKAILRVALPNYSEHQTGLAIDFSYYRKAIENEIMLEKEVEIIEETDPEFIWITTNMHLYGFILRYPKDKIEITGYAYEPWHIRFVGVELAKHLYENNLTLEEYHQKKLLK